MIPDTRVRALRSGRLGSGDFVLYWMQASVRSSCNHALEYAIEQANSLSQPLVVYFGITDSYPEANVRHYRFMIEGLREVEGALKRRGILLVVRRESPEQGVIGLAKRARLVVTDRGYTRIQRGWRSFAAQDIDRPLIQVESDVIVPVEQASGKEEYSAATLRTKLRRILPDYLVRLRSRSPVKDSLGLRFDSVSLDDIPSLLAGLDIDGTVPPVSGYRGGTGEAQRRLRDFLEAGLDRYPELSRDPGTDGLSGLSPYLHFGQISPLEVALEVEKRDSPGRAAFLEELIVRRELSMNFVFFNPAYDRLESLPQWCLRTLAEHAGDEREYEYGREEWEAAQTHDPFWNAAQQEMLATGKMHGYMRMYWGKKILEWSAAPEEAFATALYLNNKYELDGRDPNGFAGVAWCFGKHDRPWKERPVLGKIRYMSAGGLRRKFDMDGYLRRLEQPAPHS